MGELYWLLLGAEKNDVLLGEMDPDNQNRDLAFRVQAQL